MVLLVSWYLQVLTKMRKHRFNKELQNDTEVYKSHVRLHGVGWIKGKGRV